MLKIKADKMQELEKFRFQQGLHDCPQFVSWGECRWDIDYH